MNIYQVCQVRPPFTGKGKSYPTCGLTCARVLEYAVSGSKSPPGTVGYTPPPPPPPPPTHAHTMPVYGNTPQINDPALASVHPNVDMASFLAGLSMASPAAGSHSRRPRGGHGSTLRRTRPHHTTSQDDDSTTSTVPAALSVVTDPCVVRLPSISLFIVDCLNR